VGVAAAQRGEVALVVERGDAAINGGIDAAGMNGASLL
jgi:hypothetical protein